ncbi:beta-lactamase domain protein [Methylocella silvestris BL2]|uniref:Beta-lactamase domain protein n=1 Tax=Methylocella silvestris (strain DSM 15510 / CIP 108128 / LMG 27833 / NCIMB 13906 / BL2) TaxID=395965 RepID=B8EQW3_METSB|nr:MBL fold metallo-hydrolase [Methylocella silvestris]ACK49384.1 beta-lactamase domain protein [Methylocella silvestris BL2]
MRKTIIPAYGLTLALTMALSAAQAASLQEAAKALGVDGVKTLEFSGSGRWFQFGQAPNPNLPWPQFDVSSYLADINYDVPSARVQVTRKQTIEPGRLRPAPVEQKPDLYVSGAQAWNVAPPPNSPPGTAAVATPQPAAVEERLAEIWSTPQGFLKAAFANNAKSEAKGADVEVSFTVGGKYHYIGAINARNQLERVRTWIDNPVLGDTLVETSFGGYKDFGGVQFPARIARTQGGHPVLDLDIASVKLNPPVDITVPQIVASAPPQTVDVKKLADGVFYLTGGTHHSVAIEQRDHVVLVEAPLNEERSRALIGKIAELVPGKPIKYVVSSHLHFDHSGGLRAFADAGATIVTQELDKPYFEKAWAAPRTLNPDLLSKSQKAATFQTYGDKFVLNDGSRSIEIHKIAGSGHADDISLIYLPAEKILIEADVYTPAAPNAPRPTTPNPYSVNLYDNILRLKLDVDQIAALHGPGVVKLADLRAAIGQTTN